MQEKEENITKIIDRLKTYIELKGVTFNKVAVNAGISNSYFSKMKKTSNSFGSEILEKIFLYFEDLNPNWLITGRGEMEMSQDPTLENNPGNRSKQERTLLKMIVQKDYEIKDLNREIGALRQEIDLLKGNQKPNLQAYEAATSNTLVAESQPEYKGKKKK